MPDRVTHARPASDAGVLAHAISSTQGRASSGHACVGSISGAGGTTDPTSASRSSSTPSATGSPSRSSRRRSSSPSVRSSAGDETRAPRSRRASARRPPSRSSPTSSRRSCVARRRSGLAGAPVASPGSSGAPASRSRSPRCRLCSGGSRRSRLSMPGSRSTEEASRSRSTPASVAWLRGLSVPRWDVARPTKHGPLHAGDLLASWAAHDARHLGQVAKRLLGWSAQVGAPSTVLYAG